MDSLKKEYDLLVQELTSEQITNDQIRIFLEKHSECYSASYCKLCEYVDDEGLDDILEVIASNPTLDEQVQSELIDIAANWQGKEIGVMAELAGNSNLSQSLKSYFLDPSTWYGKGEGHELIELFLEYAQKNPKFSHFEIEEFTEECKRDWGFGDWNHGLEE